jgi:multiple sugar transport system permease protein
MGGTSRLATGGNAPARAQAHRPSPRRRGNWGDRFFAPVAVLPTTAVMLLVFGLPLLFSLWLSTEAWSPDQSVFGGKFAGIDNYQDLLTDPEFIGSLTLTIGYTAAAVAAELAAGLGIALLLNIDLPWIGVFRTCLIIPMMITPVVAAFCWKLLLDPDHGVINYFLSQHIVWLGRPDTALLSVGIVNVWQNAPYVAILLLAGLRSLPSEPMEAARIDGASPLQMFWHVTLPLLRPYILVALLLRMIFEFRSFDNVYVMTSGGPADATMVLSMYTYLASFVRFDMSLGAAASWVMMLISVALCGLFILLIRRRQDAV